MNRFAKFFRPSLLILLLAALCFTACEPDDVFIIEPPVVNEETGSNDGTTTSGNNTPAAFETMLGDINALRAEGCRCGNENMPPVGALSWNTKIAAAALQHSNDMAQMNQLSHTGSDGSSAGDRLHDAGYLWQAYGENIASGYASASAVLQGWIDSPGHCRNLMSANFTQMGAARNDRYWTQVFARPK